MLERTIFLPYDKGLAELKIANERLAGILTVPTVDKTLEKENTEAAIVRQSLINPIQSKRLRDLSIGKNNIVIITSDHTRSVPSAITLPLLLAEIREGNPQADITIIVATGLHRGMTHQEMEAKFGAQLVAHERIVNHDAYNPDNFINLGVLPSGSKCEINRIAVEADLLIAEGFIEPHFFAGFSGGRKSILPGIASQDCVNINHSAKAIQDARSITGMLDGNPIHQDMITAARMAKLAFILNVLLDEKKHIVAAYCGDVDAAHREGARKLVENSGVDAIKADIVVTTNGGYPLDQNLYQCPKGLSSAIACANDGAVLILVAACTDGLGGENFGHMMQSGTPDQLMERILATPPEKTISEQWCVQRFAEALQKHPIILVSTLAREVVEAMGFMYASTSGDALREAYRLKGPCAKVTVIPDGVSVIVRST
ncbi:MAG: nickel-dependent lactate racemase [Sphaerochaetaceae bacterium]